MNKREFLTRLREGLNGLPQADIEERLTFYGEMIDDRIEDGLREEAAVNEIGSVDKVISQILADTPITKLVKEKVKPTRALKAWEIVLLVLGSPIWVSLLIAVFAVVLSLYISLWAVIVSLWAVFAAFVGFAFGGIISGIVFVCNGNALTGVAVIGAAVVCAGISVLVFFGCRAATKGIAILTKKAALGIKKCFVKKEEAR